MKKNTLLLTTALALYLGGCSDTLQVKYDKDPHINFSTYKTYAWMAPGDSALNSRRDDKLFAGTIEYNVNQQLKKKGMVMDVHQPDAIFMFDTRLEDRMAYEQAPTLSVGVGYGGPGYYVGGMAPVAGGQITEKPYQAGTLILEMYDSRTRQLIWRSWAHKSLDASSDVNSIIKTAVYYMMDKLPVKIKK